MKEIEELVIYCDGASRGNPGSAAGAFVVFNKKGKILGRGGKTIGVATNNMAEYSALVFALEWLSDFSKKNSVARVFFNLDSQLVVNQLTGKFRIKSRQLLPLILKIRELEKDFQGELFYKSIPRAKNKIADFLVNKILDQKK